MIESVPFAVYDAGTGRVLRSGTITTGEPEYLEQHLAAQARPGEGVVRGTVDPDTQSVVEGRVVNRLPMPCQLDRTDFIADGVETIRLTYLPRNAVVTVGPQVYEVADGELLWGTTMAGSYPLTVTAWPFRDFHATLTGSPAS